MKVISLFDHSGVMVEPWRDAGYDCWIVDIDHPVGTTERDGIHLVGHDLAVPWLPPFDRDEIVFVAAFPPCTHLAVSGARWFKGKGLRRFAEAVTLFATSAEFCEWSGAKYLVENPVSTMATYWRKPDHSFHPWQYAGLHGNDNYTKKTCLWTGGGFTMPPVASLEGAPEPDNRIWEMGPSNMRGRFRSQTPLGFARAVFYANEKKEEVS